jgi:ABC-2 type transport system ATP-binding protein
MNLTTQLRRVIVPLGYQALNEILKFAAVTKVYRRPVSLLRPWAPRPRIVALRDVDVDVWRGEVVCLLGPNGAGKSTLLRIASGAVVADSGVVEVNAPSVGLVAGGERSFYWRLSGEENLRFFAALYGIPAREVKGRVAAALGRVGLAERAADAVRSYSAGMRQRLAFARALLADPALLLVDELAGDLDYPTTLELARFVAEDLVRAEGRAALVATHQLWLARMMADRVVVLVKGRVAAAGTPAEVLGVPRARYGARLGRADDDLVGRLRAHVSGVAVEAGPGGSFVYFDEPADAAALAAAFEVLAEAGASPAVRAPEAAETAYLSLVGGAAGV